MIPSFFRKKISFALLIVLLANIFLFPLEQIAHAQNHTGSAPESSDLSSTISSAALKGATGLTALFGKAATCDMGGSSSELFGEILGPLGSASRASSVLAELTDSDALRALGMQIDGAGNIINSLGNTVSSVQKIADGDMSGLIDAAGGVTELGSLLDQSGLVDVSGLMGKLGVSGAIDALKGGVAQLGGYISSSIGSFFGSSAAAVAGDAFLPGALGAAGSAAGTAAGGAAGAGSAAGGEAVGVLAVPVNDTTTHINQFTNTLSITGSIAASTAAINELQQRQLEVETSLQFKEYVLDCMGWNLSHRVTERVVADTIDWVTRGNKSLNWFLNPDNLEAENPYYVTNSIDFYNKLGVAIDDSFMGSLERGLPPSSYKAYLLKKLEEDRRSATVAERLTPTVDECFYTDFMSCGGWQAQMKLLNDPVANDPFTGLLFAQEARKAQIDAVANSFNKQLEYGQGYLPDYDEDGNIATPAALVHDQASEAVSTGMRSLENAQNFWQLVGRMGSLVTDIFRGPLLPNGTRDNRSRGFSKIATASILTPAGTSTYNPFLPSTFQASSTLRIRTKLGTAYSALNTAAAFSPVFPESFANATSTVNGLSTRLASSTLAVPVRSEYVAAQTQIESIITSLAPFSTDSTVNPWYRRVFDNLTTAKNALLEIIAILDVASV